MADNDAVHLTSQNVFLWIFPKYAYWFRHKISERNKYITQDLGLCPQWHLLTWKTEFKFTNIDSGKLWCSGQFCLSSSILLMLSIVMIFVYMLDLV